MRIQHNIMAMNAYRNYTNNTSALSANLEKLSSGYKINRAGDDAAGLAISEKMRAQITGLDVAQKNAKDGISLVQTAEGALTEVHDMLNRMVELASQSANGTYDNETDRANLQKEMDQLLDEIDRIADSSNFNGINLLDGTMSVTGGATEVTIEGINSDKSAGTAGSFLNKTAVAATSAGIADGDKFSYTVALNDGTSYTVDLTFKADAGQNETGKLVGADGTVYGSVAKATTTGITQAELTTAIVAGLNDTALADNFSISGTNGVFTLTNLEEGASAPQVTAFDYKTVIGGTITHTADGLDGASATGIDAGREITATDITEYDGTNYEDAVFTINGKKFVLMTETMTGTGNDFMNATKGLGSDVTVLIGGQDGLTAADGNFAQNIAKIAEATGLTVTNAIAEAGGNTGAAAGAGIRLSPGPGAEGGLVLQIGDTSDSWNQLRVDIQDMHTDSLGIDGLDISEQGSAQAAIDKIKDAINTVSSVRGTLGATQNRLDHTINNLSVMEENIQDAESTIRDTDVAEEMMEYTKNNILIQSAQAMLAQANQVPQGVLQLLQ